MVRCSFHFTKIKEKETIYPGFALVPFPVMDAAALNQAGQLFRCVFFWWGFLRENQTKSDKRNISPGVLTIESCDVFCLQQPSSLFWTLSVTSLETIWDCVGSVFVCRFVLQGESIMSAGVDWWDRHADSVFVSSITFAYSKWFFNKLQGDG